MIQLSKTRSRCGVLDGRGVVSIGVADGVIVGGGVVTEGGAVVSITTPPLVVVVVEEEEVLLELNIATDVKVEAVLIDVKDNEDVDDAMTLLAYPVVEVELILSVKVEVVETVDDVV